MLVDKPSPEVILSNIKDTEDYQSKGFLILVGEKAKLDIGLLIDLLNIHNINFCGAIFPGVLHFGENYPDKALVLPMNFNGKPILVNGLDNGKIEIEEALTPFENGTLLVLLDGISSWISHFLYKLYESIGTRLSVFGSGAGIDSFDRVNCIFNCDGLFRDVALLIPIKQKISQSIQHGWQSLAGPFIATKTEANQILEIDWEPAFNAYQRILKDTEQQNITLDNFYEIAKNYPFGIYRTNGENLIRDPVKVEENGALRFVAEIPKNTVLFLMKSDQESMLKAGLQVCNEAFANSTKPESVFVVDCVSRTKILLDKFTYELESIENFAKEYNVPVYGVLSLGEISSANNGILEYHNKTLVISILQENG